MSQPIWQTPAGTLGAFSSTQFFEVEVFSNPVSPAQQCNYQLLNGNLPSLYRVETINNKCKITGQPNGVDKPTDFTFTIRVYDEFQNFADRTFSFTLLTAAIPNLLIPSGNLVTIFDSEYFNFQLQYSTTIPNDTYKFFISSGNLPNGLYLDENTGLISGYAKPPVTSVGFPTTEISSFTVNLVSNLGTSSATYSITVVNVEISNPTVNPRNPVILNYNPAQLPINQNDPYFDFYLNDSYIPVFKSGDFFSFKIIGFDFDGTELTYNFSDLPQGLTGDPVSGWITGTVNIGKGISSYNFNVFVSKVNNLSSAIYEFNLTVSNEIINDIVWVTQSDLGLVYNNSISTLKVETTSTQNVIYRLISGALPSQLTLAENGELQGRIAYQPTGQLSATGSINFFEFEIEAVSIDYPLVKSTKNFTLGVLQYYSTVVENVYLKASPNLNQRTLINELLKNTVIFPNEFLYRKDDKNFGKANNISFVHVYGVEASNLTEYTDAIQKNHYYLNVTLGELKTAIARDENGDIIYEVVYSEIIDSNINNKNVSVSKQIRWPSFVSLNQGPYLTSEDFIYTSFSDLGNEEFYTSLTPGQTNIFYPASLDNMKIQLEQTLGTNNDSTLLPKWMTTQQLNGNVLGYVRAWVLCYTIPNKSNEIANNINTLWPYKLNEIEFTIDRYYIDKSNTYNYNAYLSIPGWSDLPSATPKPDPIDSRDFIVPFPQKTILP